MVDHDTPAENRITKSLSNAKDYALVFSDEFNYDGRSFRGEDDPKWTALRKPDNALGALQYYNDSKSEATTAGGQLVLTVSAKKAKWVEWDHRERKMRRFQKNYTSALVTSWNKFCFTGGIVEMSVHLPGEAHAGGLWPAAWLLGNLARPTYDATTEYVWPWSYDTCDDLSEHEQLISACADMPNPKLQRAEARSEANTAGGSRVHRNTLRPFHGRGAPEIDVFEAMASWDHRKPTMTSTLTVSPGIMENRPEDGHLPNSSQTWYPGLEFGDPTTPSQLNTEWYGRKSGGRRDQRKYWADAISARSTLGDEAFLGQTIFRVEWEPGPRGYVRWYANSKEIFGVRAESLHNASGASIPSEPMQIIFNVALNNYWGQPQPCDVEACPACFGCLDCANPECQCALAPLLRECQGLPAQMKIDYVRVFQDPKNDYHTAECSPPYYPTAAYIKANEVLFRDWEPTPRPPMSAVVVLLYWITFAMVLGGVALLLLIYVGRGRCAGYTIIPDAGPRSPAQVSRLSLSNPDIHLFGQTTIQRSRSQMTDDGPIASMGRCLGWYNRNSSSRFNYRVKRRTRDETDSPRTGRSSEEFLFGEHVDRRDTYTSLADVIYEPES